MDEAALGDPEAAARRLMWLQQIPLLTINDAVEILAESLLNSGLFPLNAAQDVMHIAVASVHNVDFLLTWNCKHIANAILLKDLANLVEDSGHSLPVICTPQELLGE